jgi:hypothetical protein
VEKAMKPCVYCDTPIDSDIHEEELGMCLDCSNAYWSHDYEYLEKVMSVVSDKVEL